jgi:hypothetical protein
LSGKKRKSAIEKNPVCFVSLALNALVNKGCAAIRHPIRIFFDLIKGCLGWGANPGSLNIVYFLIPPLYR